MHQPKLKHQTTHTKRSQCRSCKLRGGCSAHVVNEVSRARSTCRHRVSSSNVGAETWHVAVTLRLLAGNLLRYCRSHRSHDNHKETSCWTRQLQNQGWAVCEIYSILYTIPTTLLIARKSPENNKGKEKIKTKREREVQTAR